MQISGYDRNFREKVIKEGIKGFEKAVARADLNGKESLRLMEVILKSKSARKSHVW